MGRRAEQTGRVVRERRGTADRRQRLLYQRNSGGWPKNIDMAKPLDEVKQRVPCSAKKEDRFDDRQWRNVHAVIVSRARLHGKQHQERHRESFLKGLDYLLKAQYPNGGWPQFYPDLSGYYKHITFNDDAMIGVMKLLRDVAARNRLTRLLTKRVVRCARRGGGKRDRVHSEDAGDCEWAAHRVVCAT